MKIMKIKSPAFVICAIALAFSWPAGAQVVTFTSANGELSGLSPATPGPLTSAAYVPGSPGYWRLSSPDNVGGGNMSQFNDTAMILVNNGYDGASLGTLGSLLAQGAAGNVSFNLLSMTPGNQYAYWDVLLADPNDPLNTILIANAYSDNQVGANPFNQGAPGSSSVDASVGVLDGTTYTKLWEPWTTVENLTPVAGDPALANWVVNQLSISVGGWNSGDIQVAEISSVTVPGSDPVPDATATLPLLGICLGGLAALRRRPHRP
jgi:hypothetical protein